MWDVTVGGSAMAGDTSSLAAEREVLEELGYRINLDQVRPSLTVNYDVGFDDFYLVEEDVEPETLNLQYEEVQRVKWATEDEILLMIDSKDFIPYHKSLIALLFDMRTHMGAHREDGS